MSLSPVPSPHPGDAARVRVDESSGQVTIDHLALTSRDVLEHFRGIDAEGERVEEMRLAIEIGVGVMQRVRAVSETDYVQRRIAEMTGDFESAIGKMERQVAERIAAVFDPEGEGSASRRLAEIFERQRQQMIEELKSVRQERGESQDALAERINRTFDLGDPASPVGRLAEAVRGFERRVSESFDPRREGSYVQAITAGIERAFGERGQVASTVRSLLSLDVEDSPLRAAVSEMRGMVSEIKREIEGIRVAEKTEAELREKMSQKGVDFEDVLETELNRIAEARGDVVERVGTQAEGGAKTGDFLYTFDESGARIAIEAKNKVLGVKPTWDEAERARRNRAVEVALIVFAAEEQMHESMGGWAMRAQNKIATHLGLLRPTLGVAHLLARRAQSAGAGVDALAISGHIQAIEQALKNLPKLKRSLTGISDLSDRVRGDIDAVAQSIAEACASIAAELAKAESD
jgi:hypothetical protein